MRVWKGCTEGREEALLLESSRAVTCGNKGRKGRGGEIS